MKIVQDFQKTVLFLGGKLKDYRYAFRGTTSLVLQGLKMNVDDIDILTDEETALVANDLFAEYLIEEVKFQESDKFKSYFGKFKVNGIQVEVMGDWEIKNDKGVWSRVYWPFDEERILVEVGDEKVWVTTIQTELSMFAAMGRWNAFHKIKKELKKKEDNKQKGLF